MRGCSTHVTVNSHIPCKTEAANRISATAGLPTPLTNVIAWLFLCCPTHGGSLCRSQSNPLGGCAWWKQLVACCSGANSQARKDYPKAALGTRGSRLLRGASAWNGFHSRGCHPGHPRDESLLERVPHVAVLCARQPRLLGVLVDHVLYRVVPSPLPNDDVRVQVRSPDLHLQRASGVIFGATMSLAILAPAVSTFRDGTMPIWPHVRLNAIKLRLWRPSWDPVLAPLGLAPTRASGRIWARFGWISGDTCASDAGAISERL